MPDPVNYSIVLRFLGTTPSTSNIIKTYTSILHQIARIFNIKMPPYAHENKQNANVSTTKAVFITFNEFFEHSANLVDDYFEA